MTGEDVHGRAEREREALRRWAVGAPGCRLLVLFGSRATERAAEGADLDLALQYETLPPPDRRLEIIPGDLADRLAGAAGLRNVLVHMYDDIDYEIVAASVSRALDDFGRFLDLYRERLD